MKKSFERLTIKGFAGIEQIALEPARVTAIIGPQASGKSVTAKLLYFFRGIWRELFFYLEGEHSPDARKEHLKQQFRRYFPVETWGDDVFVLQYEFGEHKVQLRRAPSRGKPSEGLVLALPAFCDELFAHLKELTAEALHEPNAPVTSSYQVWRKIEPFLKHFVGANYYSNQLFIPAGRSFFSNVENNVFSFISRSEKSLDPFLADFGGYFNFVKSRGYRRNKREYSTELAAGLLGGKLVIDREREYVHTRDNRQLPLNNLSSGQQEALPLLMMLEPTEEEFQVARGDRDNRVAAYIEEPEAHLFPDFQRVVTERIAEYAMAKDGAQSVTVTTHSPYVLSTLNNLMLAGRLGGRRAASKQVAEIIASKNWLPKGSVAAYAFSDGKCRSIVDEDFGLIDAHYLDSVSSVIAQKFEALLSIEFPDAGAAS